MKTFATAAVLLLFTMPVVAQPAPPAAPAAPATVPPAAPLPYGPPITLEQAKKVMAAAEAEAQKNSWPVAISIIDSGGHDVLFTKLDNTQHGSIRIAKGKATTVKSGSPTGGGIAPFRGSVIPAARSPADAQSPLRRFALVERRHGVLVQALGMRAPYLQQHCVVAALCTTHLHPGPAYRQPQCEVSEFSLDGAEFCEPFCFRRLAGLNFTFKCDRRAAITFGAPPTPVLNAATSKPRSMRSIASIS
jgi:Haem-degrading